VAFDRSELGKSRPASSFVDASALYEYDPGSLVYGAETATRKGRQAESLLFAAVDP
jgi:CRISPR-associated protein Csb1